MVAFVMRSFLAACILTLCASTTGCSEDFATKMCLSEEGTSQDCGISCGISKNEKACAKWAKMTTELCGKIGKEKCQEICVADKNPTACDLAAKM